MHISWLEGLRNHEHRTRCEQEVLRLKRQPCSLPYQTSKGRLR